MRKIRWGILATGGIAAAFTEDLLTMADADVVAVGSRSDTAARRFAQRYAIARAHGSWQALADDPDVDVVYVATPHSAHHDAAAVCLDAGKSVLVEKPFALNAAQGADLARRAANAGAFAMEAMWTHLVPAVRRMCRLIADGAIGTPRLVTADFGLAGPFESSHRLRDPALGGGALLDLGVYPVSLAHLVLGPPDTVRAVGTRTPEGVDETTAMALGYDSGAVATLSCSITADTPHTAAIAGTAGRIEIDREFFVPHGFTLYRGDDVEEVAAVPDGRGYVHEAAEVMACLRSGQTESRLLPLAGTLAVLRTLDEVRSQLGVRYPAEVSPG